MGDLRASISKPGGVPKPDFFHSRYFDYLTCALIGAAVFLLVHGVIPLDVTRDDWILNGYVEGDIIQHYSGWLHYRGAPWAFPLGQTPSLGWPTGTNIAFTDSIPLVAFFFKLLSPVLPQTFQYLGLYNFFCYVMQGLCAGLLMRLFTQNKAAIYAFALVLAAYPIMVERSFRHTGLASHWLVLLALYAYFLSLRGRQRGYPRLFLVLMALSGVIHPYFTPMILGILCAAMLNLMVRQKIFLRPALFIVGSLAAMALPAWAFGVIGGGASGASGGYGYFSMNLNAPINPSSLPDTRWSRLLPVLPQTLGNYDGFNYLGLGVLLFGLLAAAHRAITFAAAPAARQNPRAALAGLWRRFGRPHIGLVVLCPLLTLFAISTTITLNSRVLLEIPLPAGLQGVLSILRSSGRMFYPVSYLLVLALFVYAARRAPGPRLTTILMVLLAAVQLADISPGLAARAALLREDSIQTRFAEKNAEMYETAGWQWLADEFDTAMVLNPLVYPNEIAAFTGKAGMACNVANANRGDYTAAHAQQAQTANLLLAGALPPQNYAILLEKRPDDARPYRQALNPALAIYDLGSEYYGIFYTDDDPPFALAQFEEGG